MGRTVQKEQKRKIEKKKRKRRKFKSIISLIPSIPIHCHAPNQASLCHSHSQLRQNPGGLDVRAILPRKNIAFQAHRQQRI